MGLKLASAFVEVQMELDRGSEARAKSQVKTATDAMERNKVELKTDNRPLKKGLDEAERSTETAARSMASTFARVFTGAAVVAGLKDAIDSASDLGESMNAVNVTFGEAADGVHALGEESAQSLGLATSEFNALAVRFSSFASTIAGPGGDVAKTLDDMTTRAADFASVMNIDVADAAELFQSGLAGESEPLRQYGIDLSAAAVEAHALETGISDGTTALTEAEKVQARYSLLMQSTNQVAGDFANTSDSVANKQRIAAAEFENAKAKLGTALLPIYSQAISVVSELVEIFTSLPAPVQAGVIAMLGVAAVAGPVKDAVAAFGGLSNVIGKLGAAGGPLLALTVAVGAAALVFNAMGKEQRELEARTSELAEALPDQTAAVLDLATALETATDGTSGLALANSALGQALANTGADGQKLRQAFGTLGLSIGDVVFWMDALQGDTAVRGSALEEMARQAGVAEEHLFVLADVVEQVDTNAQIGPELWRRYQSELGYTADQATDLVRELMPVAMAMEEVDDQSEKFDGNAATRDFLQLAAGASDTANGLIEMAEAQTGLSRNGEHTRSVMAALLEIITALPPEAEAAARAALGLDGATGELGDSANAAVDAVEDAVGKFPLLTGAIDKSGAAADGAAGKWDFITGSIVKAGDAAGGADDDFTTLAEEVGEATAEFVELEDAADRLREAIRRVVSPSDDLRETTRDVWREFENLAKGLEENGNSYDVATEAGRANQEQLEATRDAVLAHGVAMVGAGESIDAATGDIESNIEALKEQWRQAGLTEEQIADLIEQYNLTPEDIETVLQLEGEAAAREGIKRHQDRLSEIPGIRSTEVQVAIRPGDTAAVRAQLDAIEDEQVNVHINVSGYSSSLAGLIAGRAEGGYNDRPELAVWGEAGPEAMLPLSRPARLRRLLADPRIGDPIEAALAGDGHDAGGINLTAGGLSIGAVHVGSRDDLPRVTDAFDEVLFRWRTRS